MLPIGVDHESEPFGGWSFLLEMKKAEVRRQLLIERKQINVNFW